MDAWQEDPEGPSEADLERFGDEFRTCPECSSLVYDQSDICQACGYVFVRDETGLPKWVVAVILVVLAAFVLVVVL